MSVWKHMEAKSDNAVVLQLQQTNGMERNLENVGVKQSYWDLCKKYSSLKPTSTSRITEFSHNHTTTSFPTCCSPPSINEKIEGSKWA